MSDSQCGVENIRTFVDNPKPLENDQHIATKLWELPKKATENSFNFS